MLGLLGVPDPAAADLSRPGALERLGDFMRRFVRVRGATETAVLLLDDACGST